MAKKFDIQILERALKQVMSTLPWQMGNEMVNFSKDSFKAQGWEYPNDWPARKSKDDGKRRALLVKTGRLRRSIRITRITSNSVTIGADVPYAQVHNEGGTFEVPVTDKMRKWAFAASKKNKKYLGLALTKKQSLSITIPQRRFIGENSKLDRQLEELIERELKRALSML